MFILKERFHNWRIRDGNEESIWWTIVIVVIVILGLSPSCITPDSQYKMHQVHMYTQELEEYCDYCRLDKKFKNTHKL